MHYERLTRWMLAEMPARADVVIEIGPDHKPL
jgi:D-glycerate 3-kinase